MVTYYYSSFGEFLKDMTDRDREGQRELGPPLARVWGADDVHMDMFPVLSILIILFYFLFDFPIFLLFILLAIFI